MFGGWGRFLWRVGRVAGAGLGLAAAEVLTQGGGLAFEAGGAGGLGFGAVVGGGFGRHGALESRVGGLAQAGRAVGAAIDRGGAGVFGRWTGRIGGPNGDGTP
jgi:hypothetical protein